MDSESLWLALALVLIIEGIFPFVAPTAWRRMFSQLIQMPDVHIRWIAMGSMALGMLTIWLLTP
ncbi:MAG: DUF2065 domain-containing protein [Rhodoferax sp.]|nr:DUF2065 domain-containing protein [Rhodoferax sp.]